LKHGGAKRVGYEGSDPDDPLCTEYETVRPLAYRPLFPVPPRCGGGENTNNRLVPTGLPHSAQLLRRRRSPPMHRNQNVRMRLRLLHGFVFHPQYSAILISSDTFDTESGYHSDINDGTIAHLNPTRQNPLASVQLLTLSNITKPKRNAYAALTHLQGCVIPGCVGVFTHNSEYYLIFEFVPFLPRSASHAK